MTGTLFKQNCNQNENIQLPFLQTNCTCHLAILRYPTVKNSTSVADPDLQIRGGGSGHPDPEISWGRGWPQKQFFPALRASFGPQKKGGGLPGPSPGSATELNTVIVEFLTPTEIISIFTTL